MPIPHAEIKTPLTLAKKSQRIALKFFRQWDISHEN